MNGPLEWVLIQGWVLITFSTIQQLVSLFSRKLYMITKCEDLHVLTKVDLQGSSTRSVSI